MTATTCITYFVLLFVFTCANGTLSKFYIMDENDVISGHFYVELNIADNTLPPIPMGTQEEFRNAAQQLFPKGSPNVTVDAPWIKHVSTCSHDHDSFLTHFFQETKYVWTNNICVLSEGTYTWILTDDYQISFGKFTNNYEFGSKHSNLAMKRTGYVAGELIVMTSTSDSKHIVGWNLDSGTYSDPIAESMNKTDPGYYIENILKPKVDAIFKTTECYDNLFYIDSEFFFPVLPSVEYVSWVCANNIFVRNYSSLVWADTNLSVCDGWGAGACELKLKK